MNDITSTVSFDQTIIDELFQLSPLPSYQQHINDDQVEELMMMLAPSPDNNAYINNFPVFPGDDGSAQNPSLPAKVDNKKRKTVHRDGERQRRHEMSMLYRSLRSRLPLELLKGKRATCDHIHEAVRYIKHLQNKIRGMNNKRDEQKRSYDQSSDNIDPNKIIYTPADQVLNHQKGSRDSTVKVMVDECMAGVEIAVDTDLKQGVALSRVLGFLTREGLTVVSCASTRVNERLLHSIKSEVTDDHGRNVQMSSELQQRLMNLITYY